MSTENKDREYHKKGLTPKKLVAYLETKAGKTQGKVANELGVNQKTVSRWTGEIEEYIKQCPEYQNAPQKIAEMIPSAFQVYENRLKDNDLNAARDVLKMAVIFVERKQIESSDSNKSDNDLWAELKGLADDEPNSEHGLTQEETDGNDSPGADETQTD